MRCAMNVDEIVCYFGENSQRLIKLWARFKSDKKRQRKVNKTAVTIVRFQIKLQFALCVRDECSEYAVNTVYVVCGRHWNGRFFRFLWSIWRFFLFFIEFANVIEQFTCPFYKLHFD